jgi:hypothetical protein
VIAAIRRIISAGTPLLLGLAIGCGGSASVDGHWLGNRGLIPKKDEDPRVIYTMGRVEVWVKGDRFEMSKSGIPLNGTLRYSDGKAVLTVTERFNKPLSASGAGVVENTGEMTMELQQDGAVLFSDPKTFDQPFKLKREAQPNR